MLRRGSFTSPAVKVMLFQASAENSDPVCDDADRDEQPERADRGQARHDLDDAARRPEVAEVVGDRGVIPAEQQADHDQPEQRAGLRGGEDVLDDPAVLEAARVGPRQQRDQRDADQLRRRQRQRVAGR